jgi:hypothetical protein
MTGGIPEYPGALAGDSRGLPPSGNGHPEERCHCEGDEDWTETCGRVVTDCCREPRFVCEVDVDLESTTCGQGFGCEPDKWPWHPREWT